MTRLLEVKLTESAPCKFVVEPVFEGTTRAGVSYELGSHWLLAKRLRAAFEAGKIYSNAELRTDKLGEIYCRFKLHATMRTLDNDLRLLGF